MHIHIGTKKKYHGNENHQVKNEAYQWGGGGNEVAEC